MKLSEIKGERTLDVISEIIEPISNIAQDKQAAALFKREKVPKGVDARNFAIQKLKNAAIALLKTHKHDIIAILAAIQGISPEEYAQSLNIAKLVHDFIEIANDSEFISLFISAQSAGSSGSAPVNSKAEA